MIVIQQPRNGQMIDARDSFMPSKLELFSGEMEFTETTTTSYGYVLAGRADVRAEGFNFSGLAGTFFCIPGEYELIANGLVAVISRYFYAGQLMLGRMENAGRLSYLNGCSSTILVPPPKLGDPILNHLHIPNGIDQVLHTHPSLRLGIVVRGRGLARGTAPNGLDEWNQPLTEGCVFMLRSGEVHGFSTIDTPGLDLITYHPDSEWGPTDEDHPMLSATVLEENLGKRKTV